VLAHTTSEGVETLQICHGKANALDLELCLALDRALADAETRAGALILTGTGSVFSAGVDLFRIVDGGRAYIAQFLPALSDLFLRLFTLSRPVVAAINGHAVAGGCILACACDYRAMADGRSRIGLPELHVGVPFPASAIELLRSVIDPARLQEFLLIGRTYEPREAFSVGLVNEVVPGEALADRAAAIARDLGSRPASSYHLTKQVLRRPAVERIRAAEGDRSELIDAWSAPATIDSVRAHIARTLRK
jgi:enoyl-CoA hydratase/carnithine racemase